MKSPVWRRQRSGQRAVPNGQANDPLVAEHDCLERHAYSTTRSKAKPIGVIGVARPSRTPGVPHHLFKLFFNSFLLWKRERQDVGAGAETSGRPRKPE
jgi:hypothetical protein